MIKVALTGSIGMGKSTVAKMFAARGVPVFDADAVVRALQGPDGALVTSIEERFPRTTTGGQVDRDALARAVLGKPLELGALEAIVHPAVQQERMQFIEDYRDAPILLFDIPLLFETGGEQAFDKVIVVSAPRQVQRQRVLKREGMTEERFAAILARQTPDAVKRSRADYVIDTAGSLDQTEAQVDAILAGLGVGKGA